MVRIYIVTTYGWTITRHRTESDILRIAQCFWKAMLLRSYRKIGLESFKVLILLSTFEVCFCQYANLKQFSTLRSLTRKSRAKLSNWHILKSEFPAWKSRNTSWNWMPQSLNRRTSWTMYRSHIGHCWKCLQFLTQYKNMASFHISSI